VDDASPGSEETIGRGKTPLPKHEPEAFRRFYLLYPRRDNPADAAKAWQSQKPSTSEIDLIFGALRPFENRKLTTQEQSRVKAPAAWLRARRWEVDAPFPGLQISDEERRRQAHDAGADLDIASPPDGYVINWERTALEGRPAITKEDLQEAKEHFATHSFKPPTRPSFRVGSSLGDIAERIAKGYGRNLNDKTAEQA